MSSPAIVTTLYPSSSQPHKGTFVEQLAEAMAELGASPLVVAPRPWRFRRDSELAGFDGSLSATPIPVFRPTYFSFSNRRLVAGISTYRWTVRSFAATVERVGASMSEHSDYCYGHFLYPAGYAAFRLAQRWQVPAFVALGESSLAYYEVHLRLPRIRQDIAQFAGVLAVSDQNRQYCIERFGVAPERVLVLPNAVDTGQFYPRDRRKMRIHLGLPLDRPIVIFAGHFIERKGPLRVLSALQHMPDVGAVFLGDGPQKPVGPQVLFAGPVPHAQVSEWLSAADLFVLPTLAEGSCSTVLEALACGLPVVSSDRPFNREILDETVASLVEPRDTLALSHALRELLSDSDRCRRMSEAALARARQFTLRERAQTILIWMDERARS